MQKKCFFLRKWTKMSNLILCFSESPKTFICVRVTLLTLDSKGTLLQTDSFFSPQIKNLRTEKAVRLKQCPFTVSALEMRQREAYRKHTGSNVSVLLNKVSALEHDRFMWVSL